MFREAYVQDDTIVFPATTMDEIERHHLRQLRQVLDRVNSRVDEIEREERRREQIAAEQAAQRQREHEQSIERILDRLSFED